MEASVQRRMEFDRIMKEAEEEKERKKEKERVEQMEVYHGMTGRLGAEPDREKVRMQGLLIVKVRREGFWILEESPETWAERRRREIEEEKKEKEREKEMEKEEAEEKKEMEKEKEKEKEG